MTNKEATLGALSSFLCSQNFDGKLQFVDPKMRLSDKEYYLKIWKQKYGFHFKEKTQNILDYSLGNTNSVN